MHFFAKFRQISTLILFGMIICAHPNIAFANDVLKPDNPGGGDDVEFPPAGVCDNVSGDNEYRCCRINDSAFKPTDSKENVCNNRDGCYWSGAKCTAVGYGGYSPATSADTSSCPGSAQGSRVYAASASDCYDMLTSDDWTDANRQRGYSERDEKSICSVHTNNTTACGATPGCYVATVITYDGQTLKEEFTCKGCPKGYYCKSGIKKECPHVPVESKGKGIRFNNSKMYASTQDDCFIEMRTGPYTPDYPGAVLYYIDPTSSDPARDFYLTCKDHCPQDQPLAAAAEKCDMWYIAKSDSIKCTNATCQSGYYSNQNGGCQICAANKYVSGPDCLKCPTDDFIYKWTSPAGSQGLDKCHSECPIGLFDNAKSLTADGYVTCKQIDTDGSCASKNYANCKIQECNPGYSLGPLGVGHTNYDAGNGIKYCKECPDGTVSNGKQKECQPCGENSTQQDATKCVCNESDMVYNDTDLTYQGCKSCTAIDENSTSSLGSDGKADYQECECKANFYRDETTYKCTACPNGTVKEQSNDGIESCTSCTISKKCPSGQYSCFADEDCEPAPLGFYTTGNEGAKLEQCPRGATTLYTGAISITDCVYKGPDKNSTDDKNVTIFQTKNKSVSFQLPRGLVIKYQK